MPVDASIYSQLKPVDLFGSYQRGVDARYQKDQRAQADQDRLNQQAVQQAYQAGMVQNPDGSVSYDPSKVQGALGALTGNPYAGKSMFDLNSNIQDKTFQQRKYEDSLKQQEIENQYREKQLENDRLNRAESRAERRFNAGLVRDEKMQALQTPFGSANTVDDAKQLKEAYESKSNFDSKIQEMIELRKKYGTEYWNREAVGRGKQLSKDLLLEYKNMAKLGVLSKSDEDIINAIIPDDPLGHSLGAPGQDPILHKLEKFKGDSDKDFQTRIQTRTRTGMSQLQQSPSASPKGKPSWAK